MYIAINSRVSLIKRHFTNSSTQLRASTTASSQTDTVTPTTATCEPVLTGLYREVDYTVEVDYTAEVDYTVEVDCNAKSYDSAVWGLP